MGPEGPGTGSRMKVSVVLGGGGMKGLAHIGAHVRRHPVVTGPADQQVASPVLEEHPTGRLDQPTAGHLVGEANRAASVAQHGGGRPAVGDRAAVDGAATVGDDAARIGAIAAGIGERIEVGA